MACEVGRGRGEAQETVAQTTKAWRAQFPAPLCLAAVALQVSSAVAYVAVSETVPLPLLVTRPPPPRAFFPAGQVATAVFTSVESFADAVPATR